MTRRIVHRTPGLIDVRSFTLMGVSAKPNSTNPIGQFGTGLKYAIAVLVRSGAQPVVQIGRDTYTFYSRVTEFRGAPFVMLRMKRKKFSLLKPSHHDLPFGTSYGKNWKMWMAFRELESNTRDEGGVTFECDAEWVPHRDEHDNYTTIIIDSDEYAEAYDARNDVFLEGANTDGKSGVQIIKAPSQRLYYRGVRALELSKPALLTYNINVPVTLTEDRTMFEWDARQYCARAILSSDDEALIESVITAKEESWEFNLEFPTWCTPSEAFKNVMRRRPKGVFSTATTYWSKHDDAPVKTLDDAWESHPRPWNIAGTTVFDANGVAVFDEPHGYVGRWPVIAAAILKRLGNEVDEDGDPIRREEEICNTCGNAFGSSGLCMGDPGLSCERALPAAEPEKDYGLSIVLRDKETDEIVASTNPARDMTYSVADALLGSMGVKGEQYPAFLDDEVPF